MEEDSNTNDEPAVDVEPNVDEPTVDVEPTVDELTVDEPIEDVDFAADREHVESENVIVPGPSLEEAFGEDYQC